MKLPPVRKRTDYSGVSLDELSAALFLDRVLGSPDALTPSQVPDGDIEGEANRMAVHKADDKDERPPDDAARIAFEEALLAVLVDAYMQQSKRIKKALREAEGQPMIDTIFAEETAAILRDVLPMYDEIASGAAQLSLSQIPIGVDWDLVNQAVLDLARNEAQRFAEQSVTSSKGATSKVIADWISTGGTMDDLLKRVERVWSGPRADAAAITEVTRLFAQGNQAAWKASGVVRAVQWKTARDERVCPICGPLHNTEMPLIQDESDLPPAHVRCRCWIVPVVKKAGDL